MGKQLKQAGELPINHISLPRTQLAKTKEFDRETQSFFSFVAGVPTSIYPKIVMNSTNSKFQNASVVAQDNQDSAIHCFEQAGQ